MLARGRTIRQSKLLFYAKMAEKGLQTYERDGWGEFPTVINPERREIRPTADRGPILLCVDTSGSMRGARETVAKALTLECMRAAKEQERDCYVFAFAGPTDVSYMYPRLVMASELKHACSVPASAVVQVECLVLVLDVSICCSSKLCVTTATCCYRCVRLSSAWIWPVCCAC